NGGELWRVGGCETRGPGSRLRGGSARLGAGQEDSIRHFETAIRLGRRMGARPIVARAQCLLAGVRLSSGPGAEERDELATMLAEAAQCARELGLVDVTGGVAFLRAQLVEPQDERPANSFRRDGDVWTVRFAGRDLRLKDGKGPRYLATLLATPERELHVLEFVAMAAPPTSHSTP